jgi:hypothetical protein
MIGVLSVSFHFTHGLPLGQRFSMGVVLGTLIYIAATFLINRAQLLHVWDVFRSIHPKR